MVILMMTIRSRKRCEVMKCRGFLQIPPMLLRTSHTPFDDDSDDDDEDEDDDHDHVQVDRDDEEEQREEREEREMILTTVQLRRASVMDTLVPQVTIHDLVSLGSDLEGSWTLVDVWFQGQCVSERFKTLQGKHLGSPGPIGHK